MRSKFVEVDGIAVSYLHSGRSTLPDVRPALESGELIVLLHDAGGNAGSWRRQIELLGERHSVLAVDLPGHGRTASTEGCESVGAYSRFVAAFVAALDLRPLVVAGRGMGASIALHYGAEHTKRTRGIVAIGSALRVEVDDSALRTWRDVMRGRAPQPFGKEELSPEASFDVMREVWMEQVRTDPRVRYHDLVAWQRADLSDVVARLRQPVLVVAGADDGVVSAAASQELCPLLPNARMEVIDGAGHALEIERPERLAEKIDRFVSSLDRDAGKTA